MTGTLTHKLDINAAAETLKSVALKTPLQFHKKLSEKFKAEIYIKREDLQVVRSYKIRGAYNLIQSLTEEAAQARGCVCECRQSCARCCIFMPAA